MSINTELQQLKQTKTGIRAAILDRGVKVGNEAYSLYPDRIRAITTTAGTYDNFLKALLGGNITDLVIPDGTTRIRSSLFMYNTTIETLYVPSSVDRIDMMAFWECTNLTSVEFEEGITVIGSDAFRNCTGLTSVTIPASVTIFDAFTGCSSLTDITFLSETPPELGQYSLDGTNDCPIYVPDESVDAYKTANNWTRYASRIQAKPVIRVFEKVTDVNDVTDGTYLIVWEDPNNTVALNASLLDHTGYATGLNGQNSGLPVTISNGEIVADANTLAAALDYDSTNGYFKKDGLDYHTYYLKKKSYSILGYIFCGQQEAQTPSSTRVSVAELNGVLAVTETPHYIVYNTSMKLFKYYTDTSSNAQFFTYMALYKLVE